MDERQPRPHPLLGRLLIAAGVLGVVAGVVPLAIITVRVLVGGPFLAEADFLAHGVAALGFSPEWGMLSSAMGACLGVMMIWAGVGWLRARPWARLVSWVYVVCGLMVNIPDMTVFVLLARHGSMRTQMLIYDGIAAAIPVALGVWLWRRSPRRRPGKNAPRPKLPAGRASKVLGWLLAVAGVIGIITGLVPLTSNALRVLVSWDLWGLDVEKHAVEAMGLTVEWGLLSSSMGTFLGVMLLWAGVGWIRRRGWAPAVTGLYVLVGLTVNVTDMVIFAFQAKDSSMRSHMLLGDGLAMLLPGFLAAWLILRRRGRLAAEAK